MAETIEITSQCHPSKPNPLLGSCTAGANIRMKCVTFYTLPATKMPNAVQPDDTITTDDNRHDIVDRGHEISIQVPQPPPSAATSALAGPAFPMPDVPSGLSNWRLSTSTVARSRKRSPARQLPTTNKNHTRAINKRSPALSTASALLSPTSTDDQTTNASLLLVRPSAYTFQTNSL